MIIENIALGIDCTDGDALREAERRLKELGKSAPGRGRIYRKSVDARRNNIKFVYSVSFGEASEAALCMPKGERLQEHRPVVAGFGPAGMFCALALAQGGYRPLVFEMGADIDERAARVDKLFKTGVIDERANVCFGEGGAGTFSDGKLTTRINDKLCGFVLGSFVKFGADGRILYQAKPHVGTDKIRVVVKNIREEIRRLGGEIYFNAELTHINGHEVTINNSDKYKTQGLFLAAGHSAFRLYKMLEGAGFALAPKAYSVGFRVEHKQSCIDELVYGRFAGHKNLPPAEYQLSHVDNRGVYTFCMCPGGIVVNSASEGGALVTNGMSFSSRGGTNANAAVCVSIAPEDYGGSVRGAFDFRRRLEQAAFNIAGGPAPVQTLGDYMRGGTGSLARSGVSPSFTGATREFDLNRLFPEFINASMKNGIARFDRKLRGWLSEGAILTAPETRTSSAVRILRDSATLEAADGVYPCGEGAGYAGGIMSSAVDGIRCALKYMEKWRSG